LAINGHAGSQMPQTIVPPSATPIPGPMPEVLQSYTPVTAERLKKPEDGNWLHFRRFGHLCRIGSPVVVVVVRSLGNLKRSLSTISLMAITSAEAMFGIPL
jgi:hypothetical protein